jgi:hypothetical protein
VGDLAAIDPCPSLGDLVLAADGGLNPSHKASTTAHLRQCAPCRDRLHQANAFLEASGEIGDSDDIGGRGSSDLDSSDSSDSVSDVVAMDIGFDETLGAEYDSPEKSEARCQEFARRLHKQKQDAIYHQPVGRIRQWLPAAALIPLLIVGLTFSRMQTVVRAEELLRRASNHERSLSADRVQRTPIRLTAGGVALDAWPDATDASGAHAALEATLSRHGFDSRQPLSLAGVRAWRARPGEKHDEVFDNGDLLVLRTTTSVGELREVELTVRRHDYHVVKLALAFEGIGRLEIAEIEESARRAAKVATPVAPVSPIASSPVGMVASAAPAPAARAVAAEGAFAGSETSSASRTIATQQGLSRWLDRTFGARRERKTFVPDLQRLVGEVRQQLGALDTLARRYPEGEVVEQWADADRAALHRRVDQAYGAISRDLNVLDARIGILFGSTSRALPVSDAPSDWRHRAALALAHAEAMDREVRRLLTFDDVPSGDAQAAERASVASTFAALWDVVHAPAGGPAGER